MNIAMVSLKPIQLYGKRFPKDTQFLTTKRAAAVFRALGLAADMEIKTSEPKAPAAAPAREALFDTPSQSPEAKAQDLAMLRAEYERVIGRPPSPRLGAKPLRNAIANPARYQTRDMRAET